MVRVQSYFILFTLAFISSLGGCSLQSKHEPPNTLHLSLPEKIKGLDPIYAEDEYTNDQVAQAYESLLGYHYLKRPYELSPRLAESMPEISKDRLTYLFHLKKGVLFQDDPAFKATQGKGREMVAEDVAYSFKRLADPKLASSGWWLLDGRIVGLNEWRAEVSTKGAADYNRPVEGLKVIDRYTIKITLVRPSHQFLYFLAMPYTSIVPREAIEAYGTGMVNHVVGTGPFRLAEYNPNSKVVWVRNPTYRQETYPTEGESGDSEAGLLEDAGKPLPIADKVVVTVMIEQQPMWLNFMSGKLDVTSIPKDNFSNAISQNRELTPELQQKGMKLIKSTGLDITHLSFNMLDPIVGKNKLLRQAISLANDEISFIELFYNGRAIPAQGPIPPGLAGYDPEFKNPYRRFDIPKAKQLLAKAGYPEGKGLPALEYATLADSTGRQHSEFLQKMLSTIGIKLNINAYSWPQFLEAVKGKKAQMWSFAWAADYPDAENFLQLFYSKNVSPGPNDTNYSNPKFDRMYEESLTLSDGKERTELYKKMVQILVEDCPWVFGAHRIGYAVTQKWFKNYKRNDFDHSRYKYYRVIPELK